MPELPDIHFFAFQINSLCLHEHFMTIKTVSTWSRAGVNDDLLKTLPLAPWHLHALPRGKEMILVCSSVADLEESSESTSPAIKRHRSIRADAAISPSSSSSSSTSTSLESFSKSSLVRVSFGLSGYFSWVPKGATPPKHAHIEFVAAGGSLFYADVRRLGNFTWHIDPADLWGPDRGPDPMTEFSQFVANIQTRFAACAKKKWVIAEAMLDQSIFNGIGNYLRCEILHRVGLGPFVPFAEALLACEPHPSAQPTEANTLLLGCYQVCRAVYEIRLEEFQLNKMSDSYGGGDLFEAWLQVYNKKAPIQSADIKSRKIFWLGDRMMKPNG